MRILVVLILSLPCFAGIELCRLEDSSGRIWYKSVLNANCETCLGNRGRLLRRDVDISKVISGGALVPICQVKIRTRLQCKDADNQEIAIPLIDASEISFEGFALTKRPDRTKRFQTLAASNLCFEPVEISKPDSGKKLYQTQFRFASLTGIDLFCELTLFDRENEEVFSCKRVYSGFWYEKAQ